MGNIFFFLNGLFHMTKMAAMPIYGLKKRLLQNPASHDLETWHSALGTQVLQSLYKWRPSVDLDYFPSRAYLVICAFVWG